MTLTRLAIVAYPTLDKPDQPWIDEIRGAHDPQAFRIGPHFTLVFPFQAVAAEVASELSAIAAVAKRVPFTIRRAEGVRDVVAGVGGHVFLVPDEGSAEITDLHDRLYAGALRSHRRADVPFVPHITVGADSDFERCHILADALNQDRRIVRGVLDRIALVNVAISPVQPVNVVSLGP